MKVFIIVSVIVAVAFAKPSYLHGVSAPLAYAHVVPGAPIGPDGRVVDTPEVAVAKAAHTAAHINEKFTLANEAVKSADFVAYVAPGVIPAYSAHLTYPGFATGAPIGVDGRVVDTPEVAVAKAAHTAAHINEKITLVNEAAKNYATPAIVSAYSAPVVAGVYPAVHGLAYGNVAW